MKKLVFIPVIMMLMVSCELIKKATQIEFESKFKLGYLIDLSADDNKIDEEKVIDLSEEKEFEKYKDNLEDVQLDSVVISIESYSGPDEVIVNGTIGYSKEDQFAGTTFAKISNLNITQLYKSGSTHKLIYDEDEVDNITAIMLNDQKIKMYLDGTASVVPVKFEFVVKIYSNIVAQPID